MDNGYNPNCASCRVLLLGDNRVGKTALATQYVDEVFLSDYIPTRIETMTRREMVNGQMFVIDVFDCTSRSDYVAQRSQYIEMADVVLFVYNVLSRDSLMHLREYAKEVSNVRQKMIPKPDLQRSPRLPKDSVNDSRSPTPSSSTTSSSALARRQIPMFLVGTHTDEIKQRRRQVSTSDAEKMTEECMESMGLELSAGATIASTKSEVKKQSGILERLWKSMWSSAEDQDRQSSDVEGVEVPNGASRRLPLFELSVKNLSDVMDLFHAVIRLHMLVNGGGGSSGARRRRSLQHGGIIRPFSNRVTARGQSQAVDQKLCLPMLPTLYNESLDTDEDSEAKSKNAVAFVDNSNVNPAKPTTFAVPSNTQLRLSERIPIVRAYALSEDTKPLGDSGRTRSQSPDFRPASILKRGTPPHHRSATASGFRRSAIPPAPPAPRRNSAAPSRADLARPAAEVETRINPALLADAVRPSSPPPRVTHAPRTTTTAPAPAPAPAQAAQARPTHSNAQANGVSTQASSRPTSHPNPSTTTLPVPHPPPANHPLNIQRTAAAASRPQEQAFQDPLVFSAPAPMRGPRYATQYGRMPIVLSPMNLSDEPATLDRPPSDHITRDTQPARSRQDDGSGQCCCCVM